MKRFALTTLAAFGILLGAVPVARAADTTCTGTISNTTINGNLVVPANTNCTLGSDVTVGGNVTVDSGASLAITPTASPVKIGGNILAATSPGCFFVAIGSLAPVTIGGNVEIEDCTDDSGYNAFGTGTVKIGGNFTCNHSAGGCAAIGGSVGGNLMVDDNPGGADVFGNNVGGNVEADGNHSFTTVRNNTIGGNLTCTGNTPAAVASGNTVHGKTNCP